MPGEDFSLKSLAFFIYFYHFRYFHITGKPDMVQVRGFAANKKQKIGTWEEIRFFTNGWKRFYDVDG
ncbi:hypothetical protein [Paenibacillus sp. JCM 10914]|uniref:hypothetical protein n=1 Tax=Paenibacillus sp. JCM 10914 TaxID=1236974 RepID=UPI0003CCBA61|nr:hypothetical protein [Paenibacillus sp. JCM 10914]GAE06096.1 hypothetical protein JCM10914_2237 [Paenibacillus sp. JCM 10914]